MVTASKRNWGERGGRRRMGITGLGLAAAVPLQCSTAAPIPMAAKLAAPLAAAIVASSSLRRPLPRLCLHAARRFLSVTASSFSPATIAVGNKLPDATLSYLDSDGEIQTVIVFLAVPGAFTPTYSQKHLPGFVAKAGELRAKGVDTIALGFLCSAAAELGEEGGERKPQPYYTCRAGNLELLDQ